MLTYIAILLTIVFAPVVLAALFLLAEVAVALAIAVGPGLFLGVFMLVMSGSLLVGIVGFGIGLAVSAVWFHQNLGAGLRGDTPDAQRIPESPRETEAANSPPAVDHPAPARADPEDVEAELERIIELMREREAGKF